MEVKKTYRTLEFENRVVWKTGRRGLLSATEHATMQVGSPPAFKGDADVWCPEDLLIGALNTCLMLTFLTMAQHRDVQVIGYHSSARGTLEHRDGKYRVTRIKVEPVVTLGAGSSLEKAQQAGRDTLESCIITNSISAVVEFVPQFRAASIDAA